MSSQPNDQGEVTAGEAFEQGLRLAPSSLGGYGVFAKRPFRQGEIVECCRSIECDAVALQRTPLQDYVFGGHRKNTVLLLLGYGSLYNHSSKANLRFEDTQDGLVRFVARVAIPAGDELTIDYGKNWWDSRLRRPFSRGPRRQAPPVVESAPYGMLEKDLLLRVCRGADFEELMDQPLDWKLLITEASRNAVIPLLFQALKSREDVPELVRAELLAAGTKNAVHNLHLSSSLVEILDSLKQRGVPALAYKGPALAMLAYGSVAMRSFSDLDILVPRSQLDAAKAAMQTQGYVCTLSAREEAHFRRERYHLHFSASEGRPSVEIHWAITPAYWPFPLDPERLWGGAVSVEVAGVEVPTLDRELTLLAICAHGAKERWPRLSLVCDLAGLLKRSPSLDWNWITHQAAGTNRLRVLLLGLWLGASVLEAPVPQSLLTQARADRTVLAVASEIEGQLFFAAPLAGLRFHRYAWRIWNRWPDRIGYLRFAIAALPRRLGNLLRPTEADGSLPAGLSWLWRPVRVIWGSRNNLGRLFRKISNNL